MVARESPKECAKRAVAKPFVVSHLGSRDVTQATRLVDGLMALMFFSPFFFRPFHFFFFSFNSYFATQKTLPRRPDLTAASGSRSRFR